MEIETNPVVTFKFSAKDYFLVYSGVGSMGKRWSLNYRVDRSEKGKDDDVGIEVIYLSETEAEVCKKAGFTWLEI